jgi:DNA-binding GntR family transcriptional regulator
VVETAETHVDTDGTRAERCFAQIREMILSGEILPGQKVHQAELADQFKISRIPIREALTALEAEGLLLHKPNTGFTVARFSSEDLSEMYLMRRVLETELFRSIDLGAIELDEMIELHNQMDSIKSGMSPEPYQRLNRQFHFALFDRAPLRLVRQEVSRLWYMSGFYRSLYLHQADTAAHLSAEHWQMITAVREGDVNRLIQVANEHRSGTERIVVQLLGPRRTS